jgi:hypothetical protein
LHVNFGVWISPFYTNINKISKKEFAMDEHKLETDEDESDELTDQDELAIFKEELEEISMFRESRQEGFHKGLKQAQEQHLKNLRDLVVRVVGYRFPELHPLATGQVGHLYDIELLNTLIVQISSTRSEEIVRKLLENVRLYQ